MRLLSVDFDFFFHDRADDPELCFLYDWGRSEHYGAALSSILWYNRAAAFLRAGLDLPGTTGEEDGFWKRFELARGCELHVAESHSAIYDRDVRAGVNRCVNYDAHHDAGYDGGTLSAWLKRARVTCEDWAIAYSAHGVPVRCVYPRWRDPEAERTPVISIERVTDDGRRDPYVYGRVFLCRSGAWVPSWLDDRFDALVAEFPGPVVRRGDTANRGFDRAAAVRLAEIFPVSA